MELTVKEMMTIKDSLMVYYASVIHNSIVTRIPDDETPIEIAEIVKKIENEIDKYKKKEVQA